MAVRFLARDVSELCLGKPPLRSLPPSATVSEALAAIKRSSDGSVSVWSCDHLDKCRSCVCVGRIFMVDLICFFCKEDNLLNPGNALLASVSDVLAKGGVMVRHLDSNSSVLEAIDYILEGTQNLVIPIENNKTTNLIKKHFNKPPLSLNSTLHNGLEFCWLTQEDVVRFLLNFIGIFSPIPSLTLQSLHIIDTNISTVHFDSPLSSSLHSITQNLALKKPIAIINENNKLVGEISPYNISYCDEPVAAAAAMMTLSAGDLTAYIDYNGPEDLVQLVQMRLEEKKLGEMVDLIGELSLSRISSSTSCSSDEEFGSNRSRRISPVRRSEPIVCRPWSSLVAVMVQALAHRVNYVWVIEDDYTIAGIVTFSGILNVFRSSIGENSFKK